MKKALLIFLAVSLLAPAVFAQCEGNGCTGQAQFVARPSHGIVVVPVKLPKEPASIAEIISSSADLFAAGIVRNNGRRGITALRIGWATIDENGNLTEHQGHLIDTAWPRPLLKDTDNYVANQDVPMVADNIVKIVFFVAEVDFVDHSTYTADLAQLKNLAMADNQRIGQSASQLPPQ